MQEANTKLYETVAIIGFGMSGLSEFCAYVDAAVQNNYKCHIIIYEKNKSNFASGLPFNQNVPHIWLLNGPPAEAFKVPMNGISLLDWIRSQPSLTEKFGKFEERFPPRALIGEYLKSQYDLYYKKALEHGINIDVKYEEVLDLTLTEQNKIQIDTANEQTIVDYVGLGLGTLRSDHYQAFIGKPNFIDNPWNPLQLDTIPSDANEIVIIGGHLTFLDAIKYLVLERGCKGKIISITQNPSVMAVRIPSVEIKKEPMNQLNEEFKQHSENKLSFINAHGMFQNAYKASVKKAIDGEIGTLYALNSQLGEIDSSLGSLNELCSFVSLFLKTGTYKAMWDALDAEGQEEFYKHFFSKIYSYITGIPVINARFLKALYDENRIQELSGVTNLRHDPEKNEYVFSFKDGTEKHATHVVNATGVGRDITKHFHQWPLLKKLMEKGIITTTKFGGIITNEHGQVIAKNGEPLPNIIAVGSCVFKGVPSGDASLFIAPAAVRAVDHHFSHH